MAKVIEYKKPVLTATLTEGGTLAANTTYYMTGFFVTKYNQTYMYGGYSPMADVIPFTTTDTHKSVSIAWRSDYYDISGFTDNGDGKTRVNIVNHNTFGYTTYNEITITSGTYAGTHNVEYYDKDNLLIDVEYVDSYSTQAYFDGVGMGAASPYNYYSGLVLYMYTTDPYSTGEWVFVKGYFSHRYYEKGYEYTNPIQINAPFYIWQDPPYHYDIYHTFLHFWDVPNSVKLTERGKPSILVDEPITWEELKQLVVDCDVDDRFQFTNDSLVMYGDIYHSSTWNTEDEYINFDRKNILGVNAVFNAVDKSGKEKFIFTNCTLTFTNIIYKGYINISASNSLIKFGGLQRIPAGLGNTYQYSIAQNWYLQNNYEIAFDYLLEDVTFVSVGVSSKMLTIVYADFSLMKNVKIIDGVHLLDINNPYDYQNNRVIQGLYIESPYDYDLIVHPRSELVVSERIVSFENIDTPRDNNEKKVYAYSSTGAHYDYVRFYRTGTIKIVDKDDNVIEGADITITDNTGTIYSGTTDINGEYDYDLLEQLTLKTIGGIGTNTLYEFYLVIEKDGYDIYQQHIQSWKELETMEVSLKIKDAPVYIDRTLSANSTISEVSASLSDTPISVDIDNYNISGDVTVNNISSDILDI